jgi:hypothetical protein
VRTGFLFATCHPMTLTSMALDMVPSSAVFSTRSNTSMCTAKTFPQPTSHCTSVP